MSALANYVDCPVMCPDLSEVAEAVWRAIYQRRAWPKGWRAEWAFSIGSRNHPASGLCDYARRTVYVNYGHTLRHPSIEWNKDVLDTLVHELLHVRGHRHDGDRLPALKRYDRLVARAVRRVWERAA